MSEIYQYPGQELEVFQQAVRWKAYFAAQLRPFAGRRVLEVGAGLGATTQLLNRGDADLWLLLEPDPQLAATLGQKLAAGELPGNCRLEEGSLSDLSPSERFDTILYIDVLEHIEADRQELEKAFERLLPGGHLVVLSPAFPFLYSPFDKAIGHYRRYTAHMLRAVAPGGARERRMRYLDAAGWCASLANLLLRQSYPTRQQVLAWDRWMIPASRVMDKIFFYSFGKSILAVWQKP